MKEYNISINKRPGNPVRCNIYLGKRASAIKADIFLCANTKYERRLYDIDPYSLADIDEQTLYELSYIGADKNGGTKKFDILI